MVEMEISCVSFRVAVSGLDCLSLPQFFGLSCAFAFAI